MTTNARFVLHEDREITDLLHPSYRTTCFQGEGSHDQNYLREQVLWKRLADLIDNLLIDEHQKYEGWFSLHDAIFETILASHFVAISPAPSINVEFGRKFNRERRCHEDLTSLSIFCDDVCDLLCDLYGCSSDRGDLDKLRSAIMYILVQSRCCEREKLSREHEDAVNVDYYIDLIGWPEGYGINGSSWRTGMAAKYAVMGRAREVRKNPSAFSKYTVGFADAVAERWDLEADEVGRDEPCEYNPEPYG